MLLRPEDRRAIRTFVNKFNRAQIKEAVEREIKRGGQVFFVHNRVDTMGSMFQYLKGLLPSVSICVATGR